MLLRLKSGEVATITGVHGLCLIGTVPSGTGSQIIPIHLAASVVEFWKAWKAAGGEKQGLAWEDGTAFEAPECPIDPEPDAL